MLRSLVGSEMCIRDRPLVMHQSHSESLAVHAAQRISCYKLPHKLHQVHSAQHIVARCQPGRGKRRAGMPLLGQGEHNIHYAKCCIGRDPVRGLGLAMAPALAWLLPPCWLPRQVTATTETPQIPQLSARISPQGRPRFPDLPQSCLLYTSPSPRDS